ncbi:hypothetical protein Sme01_68420 [Sphaerisporangium melleum]|uniref:HTH luxR-type domain-containing protein n=2 Tax=Sphaerisporangium melleum TaxID=321316 RepID=A0A917RKN8_9ACTN|nr:hypothetical protein GCM10007964_62450 [Sphaerisporangium melleum]GII74366.1 hypothetical protein Sme01_68420 [Sphaerisporangium melleum]
MTSLRTLLDEAVAGRGRVAMVTGVVATGKSELLHAFADQAGDVGVLPLVATASRAESDLALGVLGQLFCNAPLTEEVRDGAMDVLRQVTGIACPEGAEGFAQADAEVVHTLCSVLLSLSERRPLAIVVDDVHYADRASLLFLSYLMRRARYSPIMAVFSQADHTGNTHKFFPTEMLRQPHCTVVRLAPLSREAVLSLAGERLGHETAERLVPEWYALSGGNPLLLQGLMEDYEAGGAWPAARYGEAVLSCLHRADPALLEAARWLAALDDPELVARLAGLDGIAVPPSMGWLEAVGLLESGRFRHEVARSSVLAELGADKRQQMHRRTAELLYDEGAADVAVAEQLIRADFTDVPWAVPVLESAARCRLGDGEVAPAVAYLELALRGCADERQRAMIAALLLRADWRVDPNGRTALIGELTDALREGRLRGGDAAFLARALLWHGRLGEARDVLDLLKGFAGGGPGTMAELSGTRAWLRCSVPGMVPHMDGTVTREPSEAVLPMRMSRRLESIRALASVLTDGPAEELPATAERILRGSCLADMSMDTVESALLALVYGGQAERAASWCDTFLTQARSRGARARQARLTAIRAETALRQGDLARAAALARSALEIISPAAWGVALGGPLATLLLAITAMGRYDEAFEQVNRPVPEGMLQTRFGLHYLQARGRYQLAVDNPASALRDFQLCGDLVVRWDMDVPGFVPWRTDVAEAHIRLGDRDTARALAEEQLARSGPGSARADGVALRMLAAAAEVRHRPMLLRQASERLQVSGDRYELARSLFDLTEAYHGVGEFRRAGIIAGRARSLAQECGARPLSQALSDEGFPGDGYEAEPSKVVAILSDAERRVAGLATVGYSNREIAAKLFITVSTVEQHLTRVYRKLNISHRSDLSKAGPAML